MTVHLVGVGPGDAELMTIRAARLLASADAVVHDRLIGDEILGWVPASAERYPVGKQPGRPGPTQGEINRLLVNLGRRLDTVVRVKGGDPYVFGRGIEEADALVRAGVACEVVPGISSAVAAPAAAGISVTERGVSSGFCVVTARQGPASAPVDWSALARTGLTLVVLMGAAQAAAIARALIDGGLDPATPAAVIGDATTERQRTWQGRLDQLGVEPVQPPSVLVIGEVAARRRVADGPRSSANRRCAKLRTR